MKTKEPPVVSVILPVYNGEDFVQEAIDSILRQSIHSFELIIIDDGSNDKTPGIIARAAKKDQRVQVITQKNHGLVYTLNKGVDLAQAELIARMDADDISHPQRLGSQIRVMHDDISTVALGCGFETIDTSGKVLKRTLIPTYDNDLRRALWLGNPFAHGSMMFRKSAFIKAGKYNDNVGPTEDYDLWLRMAEYGNIKAIPRVLFQYRINPEGISISQQAEQLSWRSASIIGRWNRSHPNIVSRKAILDRSNEYQSFTNEKDGVAIKERYLSDLSQVGVRLIRFNQKTQGIRQLFAVASTGRTGVRAVIHKLSKISIRSLSETSNQ